MSQQHQRRLSTAAVITVLFVLVLSSAVLTTIVMGQAPRLTMTTAAAKAKTLWGVNSLAGQFRGGGFTGLTSCVGPVVFGLGRLTCGTGGTFESAFAAVPPPVQVPALSKIININTHVACIGDSSQPLPGLDCEVRLFLALQEIRLKNSTQFDTIFMNKGLFLQVMPH